MRELAVDLPNPGAIDESERGLEFLPICFPLIGPPTRPSFS